MAQKTITITESNGVFTARVKSDGRVKAVEKERNLFRLIDLVRQRYPRAAFAQSHYAELARRRGGRYGSLH